MATGTVSSVSGDVWQLISSQASTSGTSITFSGISGYKKLLLTGQSVSWADNCSSYVLPNNDTTGGNYSGYSSDAGFRWTGTANSQPRAPFFTIDNADKSMPHFVECAAMYSNLFTGNDIYPVASPITSLVISNTGSIAFNGGTVYLYGIPA
jgi:hypothetical protein